LNDISKFSGHCGIQVTNIESSIAFYLSLGFKVESRYTLPSSNIGSDKVAFISLNQSLLELYQLHVDKTCESVGRLNHIAIKIDDLNSIEKLIKKNKIEILKGPKILPFGNNGMKFLTIEGPDNERVEFNQFY